MIIKRVILYLFYLFFPFLVFFSFFAYPTEYEVVLVHGRVIENGILLSRGKRVIDDGGYLRTFRDSYLIFKKAGYFYKAYAYTKVVIKGNSVKLEYGKLSRSKNGKFVEIHFLIFPKPSQGRTTKLFLSIDNSDGEWEVKVYGKNYKRSIRIYRDSESIYSGYIPFDIETRAGKYMLSVEFKSNGVSGILKYPFYLKSIKPERGLVYLQERDLGILKPSREKKAQIEELSELLHHFSDAKMWADRFVYPVNDVKVISKFGKKRLYFFNKKYMFTRFHRGVDLEAKRGQKVFAPNGGIVVMAKKRITTGNTIVIDHGRGVFSLLFHLDTILVNKGDRVDRYVVVGTAGDSGFAGGVHVHWSVVVDGIYVNPEDWVRIIY